MGTTDGRKTARWRLGGRLRPNLETLEARMVLSGSSLGSISGLAPIDPTITAAASSRGLSIVSTTPADSAVLATSPSSLKVGFDRPLDAFMLSNNDFELVHVAGDGSTSLLQPGEASLDESLDPNGRQVDLAVSKPLIQGNYRLLLNPDSLLQGLDGSSLANTGPALDLSDFTIGRPKGAFGSAVDLQVLGPREVVVPGRLDLASNPGAVQYDKFVLAPGHHWLVGLEISAHRDGGTLSSSLSLFDSRGRLISTANEGLSGDPNDPYLFAGLDPGTYYVGIASAKNIPDASGGYDPTASGVDPANPGGAFQLHAVADVADQPTRVLGLRLDQADPLSTAPTGLTLQFSGGLALSSLAGSGQDPLTLVDRSGATWSLTPTHYDPTTGQLSLAFDRPLTPGIYTLEQAAPGSLLDLAGRAPVADGLPGGTLGSFVVAPSNPVAGDLGPILPGLGASGLGSTVTVAPGRSTTEPFVVIEPGVYSFREVGLDGGVTFSVEDASGHVLATGPVDSEPAGSRAYLPAGSYQVVLTTASPQASTVSLSIVQRLKENSSLLESGVAQGPALNLRLVTPQPGFGAGSSAPTDSTPANAPATPAAGNSTSLGAPSGATGAGRAVGDVATVAVGLATPAGPSVVGLVVGGGPVGRPSLQASPIGVVGPSGASGPSGLASIASNSDGLPSGLIASPASSDADGQVGRAKPSADPETGAATSPRAGITLESGLLARSPGSRLEDDRSLAESDWFGQFLADAIDWIGGAPSSDGAGAERIEPSSTVVGASPSSEAASVEESRLESASVASPFGIGIVVGVIALGSRRNLFRRRAAIAKKGPKSGPRSPLAGPHRRRKVGVRVH